MKWYFTLGQTHTHRINGVTWDCDLVIAIKGTFASARTRMIELCGTAWSGQYEMVNLRYFPRGVLEID